MSEKSCTSCTKVVICSAYLEVKSFETSFAQKWTDEIKLSYPAESLATKCPHYESSSQRTKLQKLDDMDLEEICDAGVAYDMIENNPPLDIVKQAREEQSRRSQNKIIGDFQERPPYRFRP